MAFAAALATAQRAGLTPTCELTYANEFNVFLLTNGVQYDNESVVTWLLMKSLIIAQDANVTVPRVSNDTADLSLRLPQPAGAAQNAAPIYATDQTPAGTVGMEGVPVGQFRNHVRDAGAALFWLLDLICAEQIKPLKTSNISSYFKSKQTPGVNGREVIKVIRFGSVTLPKIVLNEALFALVERTSWVEYHIAYSSTAKLAQEMLNSNTTITHRLFSEATRDVVTASLNAIHDRNANMAIPTAVVLATYAYLVAFGKLPDAWFQGEKAKASMPATSYNNYAQIFRRMRELSAAAAGINDAVDIPALADAAFNAAGVV